MSSTTYLTPPSLDRPPPRRLHSLQPPSRHSPYSYPSPGASPGLARGSPASPASSPTAMMPKRPGAPKRAHSFCGDSATGTYALAATSSAHLASDKRTLVAPPLERTLSSIGVRGNASTPSQQMLRPTVQRTMTISRQPQIDEEYLPTPPSSPVPNILITSTTPPRPRPTPHQRPVSPSAGPSSRARSNDLRTVSDRSVSFTLVTPTTPSAAFFAPQISVDEPDSNAAKDREIRDDSANMDDFVARIEELDVS